MPVRELLLPLVGESSRSTVVAIEKCAYMASTLGTAVTALAVEIESAMPQTVADVLGASEIVQTAPPARALLATLDKVATRLSLRCEPRLLQATAATMIGKIVEQARLKDMSIAIVKSSDSFSEKLVERLLFETGRPVMICPEEEADLLASSLDDVVIAWDHSAPAARAVADALPILRRASRVRLVTATDKATNAQLESGIALQRHLATHGIAADFDAVAINDSSVGKVFEAYVQNNNADLLVMGGFRHSRLNEHIWGGVTSTIINRPPCWVMLSH